MNIFGRYIISFFVARVQQASYIPDANVGSQPYSDPESESPQLIGV